VFVALLAAAGPSAASQPLEAGPPQDSEAKVHYEKATAAYALGNFTEAAASYERAFECKPDPALLYNAAQAHRRGGNRQRAMELYRSFLQVFPRAENRDLAERHLHELERAAVSPPVPASALKPAPAADLAAAPAAPARAGRPMWKNPWLWVAVGAAAVLGAGATAAALSGRSDPHPSWGQVGP
jgi:tetratricopeptide (TPR) repeat protein